MHKSLCMRERAFVSGGESEYVREREKEGERVCVCKLWNNWIFLSHSIAVIYRSLLLAQTALTLFSQVLEAVYSVRL